MHFLKYLFIPVTPESVTLFILSYFADNRKICFHCLTRHTGQRGSGSDDQPPVCADEAVDVIGEKFLL